jgi:predicted lipoprotein with Yx(FWY)xxD motif
VSPAPQPWQRSRTQPRRSYSQRSPPGLPRGRETPFGIPEIGGRLFGSYAKQDAKGEDDFDRQRIVAGKESGPAGVDLGERQCDRKQEVHSVKRLLIFGVTGATALAAGIAIAVAATGGGSGVAKAGAATVSVKQITGAGKVLVDAKGRALYRSDQERNGMVLCTGACLSFWQPLTVSGTPKGSSLPGKLAVVKRPDGGRQVTYNGKLLYSFKLDKPGKVTGDGFKDAFSGQQFTWHVARPTLVKSSSRVTTNPSNTYPGY